MTLNDFLRQFVITIKLQNEGGVLDVQSAPCRFTEQQQDQGTAAGWPGQARQREITGASEGLVWQGPSGLGSAGCCPGVQRAGKSPPAGHAAAWGIQGQAGGAAVGRAGTQGDVRVWWQLPRLEPPPASAPHRGRLGHAGLQEGELRALQQG